MTSPTWRQLLAELSAALPPHETRLLLSSSASLQWAHLVAHLDEPADPVAVDLAHRRVEERRSGRPLQWVLGRCGFRDLEVRVDGRALVPRPETEIVVEVALGELDRIAAAGGEGHRPLAVDLGTGSGVIALSLATERPELEVVAVDASPDALELAAENLAELAAEDAGLPARVRLLGGDWYDHLPEHLRGRVDLVVSNPPYLAEREWEGLDPVVRRYDPYEALVAGPTGLEALAAVVEGAPGWLHPGGTLVVELAPAQAGEAVRRAESAGFVEVSVVEDLAGRPRVLRARRRLG